MDLCPAVVTSRRFRNPYSIDALAIVNIGLPRAVEQHVLTLDVGADKCDQEGAIYCVPTHGDRSGACFVQRVEVITQGIAVHEYLEPWNLEPWNNHATTLTMRPTGSMRMSDPL